MNPDKELDDIRRELGPEKYNRIYNTIYCRTLRRSKSNIRYSEKEYTNDSDKIKTIKEKYKNGVTADILNEWLF